MAYYGNATKVVVNAGGMTQKQVDLIKKLADQKAWDLHASQKMREWFAMHLSDIENNPATSPLTGGWKGTASAFIAELQKLPNREDVVAKTIESAKQENRFIPSGTSADEIQQLMESDPWSEPDSDVVDTREFVYEQNDDGTQGPRILGETKTLVGPGVYNLDGIMYAVKESRQNPGRHYAYSIRLVNNKFKHEYAKGVIYKLTDEMRVSAETVVALNISTIREHNGKRVGSCCVCGRMLTKKSSIDAGIGPICGGRVGL